MKISFFFFFNFKLQPKPMLTQVTFFKRHTAPSGHTKDFILLFCGPDSQNSMLASRDKSFFSGILNNMVVWVF